MGKANAEAMEKVGNLFGRIQGFFAEVRIEMSKVSWPTWEQVKMYTIVTVVACVVVSLLIGVWDILLGVGIEKLFHLRGGA